MMLKFAAGGSGPSLGMLVLHDDSERDSKYVAGAEQALELARPNHCPMAATSKPHH